MSAEADAPKPFDLYGLFKAVTNCEVFADKNRVAWVKWKLDGRTRSMPIDSKECAAALRRQFRKDFGRAAKPAEIEALREAMVDEHSLSTGSTREVFRRVAEHDGKFYLDLANDAREVVEIDREGWRIVAEPPVTFYRHTNRVVAR